MSDLFDRQTEEFWDDLVRNPDRPPVARNEDEDLILAAVALFPASVPAGSADRVRARIFTSSATSGEKTQRSGTHPIQPVVGYSKAPGRSVPRFDSRWKWASLATILLLMISAAAIWLAESDRSLPNRDEDNPAVIPAVSLESSDVSMRGVDPGRTNALNGPALDAAPAVTWTYEVDGVIRTTPIVTGGVAYLGASGLSPQDPGAIVALDANDGSLLWSTPTTYGLTATPLVDKGTIYAVDDGGILYALDAQTGAARWQRSLNGNDGYHYSWYGAPTIVDGKLILSSGYAMSVAASEDAIFVGQPSNEWLQGDQHVYAISPGDGSILWEASTSPAMPTALFALSAEDGALLWYTAGSPALLGPSYGDGLVYFGVNEPAALVAKDASSGDVQWRYDLEADDQWDGTSSPSLWGSMVIFTTHMGDVIALDSRSGDERWRVSMFSNEPASYVLPPTSVFIAGRQGLLLGHDQVVAIDLDDGSKLWELNGPAGDTTGLALVDGTLYQVIRSEADDDSMLVAFAPNGATP